MDFTREPIIETIITPREGYRLVIRSSKNLGQEEHFVEAIEVVSFGNASFFRSTERPKSFVVPVSDYEVLEVREPRMVLKSAQVSGSVKIGTKEQGGREGGYRQPRERDQERQGQDRRDQDRRGQERREQERKEVYAEGQEEGRLEGRLEGRQEGQEGQPASAQPEGRPQGEGRSERRRDRRRGFRKRRGGREEAETQGVREPQQGEPMREAEVGVEREMVSEEIRKEQVELSQDAQEPTLFRSILPPPTTLIRDNLQRLRESEEYRGAFFIRDDAQEEQDDDDMALQSSGMEEALPKEGFVVEGQDKSKEKEASSPEEPFLFSEAVDQEAHPFQPKDFT